MTTSVFNVGAAKLYYETAGSGQPMIFLHAGVADSRQWDNEFRFFQQRFSVTRYDMRGYGKSDPVPGDFTHLQDLAALVQHLAVAEPVILVGCSMGGGTALDFTLEHPGKVSALVMVDSAPSGLDVDVPRPSAFALVDAAAEAGDLPLVAELETQIWFDGARSSDDVDQRMRKLAYDMNYIALQNEAKELGHQQPNLTTNAADRLHELKVPLLAVLGEQDIPYMHAAAAALNQRVADSHLVRIPDAAHLPNMDQPAVFQSALMRFFDGLESN